MDRRAVLLLAVVGLAFASTVSAKCVGTAERPAHLITLDKGGSFCLRLPRYLPNPEKALAGTASFPRTVKDTVRAAEGRLPPGVDSCGPF